MFLSILLYQPVNWGPEKRKVGKIMTFKISARENEEFPIIMAD